MKIFEKFRAQKDSYKESFVENLYKILKNIEDSLDKVTKIQEKYYILDFIQEKRASTAKGYFSWKPSGFSRQTATLQQNYCRFPNGM